MPAPPPSRLLRWPWAALLGLCMAGTVYALGLLSMMLALDAGGRIPPLGVGAVEVVGFAFLALVVVVAALVLVATVWVARAASRFSVAMRTLSVSGLFTAACVAVAVFAGMIPGRPSNGHAPAGDLGSLMAIVFPLGIGGGWLTLAVVSALVAPWARWRDGR